MIQSLFSALFLLSGLFFVMVAAIGLLRMPDFYSRTHAAAKAGAFGGSLMLIGVAIAFASWPITIKVILVVLFFYATTPVASHMIGRAAYLTKAPRWHGTTVDEMEGQYHVRDHSLSGWSEATGEKPKDTPADHRRPPANESET